MVRWILLVSLMLGMGGWLRGAGLRGAGLDRERPAFGMPSVAVPDQVMDGSDPFPH